MLAKVSGTLAALVSRSFVVAVAAGPNKERPW